MTDTTHEIDMRALRSLPEDLKEIFGHDPLVIEAQFRDGRITSETVKAIGDAIGKRLEAIGAPPDVLARLRERVEQTIKDPSRVVDKDGQREELEAIAGAIRSAMKLLDDVPDHIDRLGVRHAGFTADAMRIHKFSRILGMAEGSVLTALGELKGALGAIEHAFECPCMNGGEHGEPKGQPEAPAAAPEEPHAP
jgi:hypothetical protein